MIDRKHIAAMTYHEFDQLSGHASPLVAVYDKRRWRPEEVCDILDHGGTSPYLITMSEEQYKTFFEEQYTEKGAEDRHKGNAMQPMEQMAHTRTGAGLTAGLGCKTCPAHGTCDATYRGSHCAAIRSRYQLDDPFVVAEAINAMDNKALASLFAGFCSVAECTTDKRGGTIHCPLYGRCPKTAALSEWERFMLAPADRLSKVEEQE